ncbi:MAG: acetylornithine deacetylase [Pseudomonadota bacterium]
MSSQHTPSSAEMLGHLISFDTTSCNSNFPLIEFAEAFLRDQGIDTTRADYAPGKTNLVASIGPAVDGGVALSGHTDTVPVTGQTWATDPFTMTDIDGDLFGRGTCDMKGFLACCLAAVPQLKARKLARPVHLVFSCDEEVSCEGVIPAVQRFGHDMPTPSICIVGEPTMMDVMTGQKACQAYVTTIRGVEAHSSKPALGWSALNEANLLITEINAIAQEMRDKDNGDCPFDPAFTTVHVGAVHSGTTVNIVPNLATISWEARLLPDQDVDEIRDRVARFVQARNEVIRATYPDAGMETDNYVNVPGLEPEPDGEAKSLAMRLTGSNRTGVVSYGTEAGHFQAAGMSTVICGPGSIDQAHKPDEFIAASQLVACDRFLDRLGADLSAP